MRRVMPLLAAGALAAVAAAALLRPGSVGAPEQAPTSDVQAQQPTAAASLPKPTAGLGAPESAPTTDVQAQQPTAAVPLPAPTAAVPLPAPTAAVPLPAPTAAVPLPVPTAPLPTPAADGWILRETAHFRLFVLPGSDAARDLDQLALVAEVSYAQAAAILPPTSPISVSVYLVPRVFWQGGVAHGPNGPLLISHLDRNYTGVATWGYLVHETTHALGGALVQRDGEVGGLLGEGIAVYASGGHYGAEPVDDWAAALDDTGRTLRLCELRFDFYAAQHEIAYLQAASYTSFLIETYGAETFRLMYQLQQPQRGNRDIDLDTFCARDDARVAAPLQKTNAELEREWRAWLDLRQPTEDQARAAALQIRFFDTMRAYQERLDPPARMLPPPPRDWSPEIWAAMRQPATGEEAAVYETLLIAARTAMLGDDLDHATLLLDLVDAGIGAGALPDDPIVRDYRAIVALVVESGFDLARLDLRGDLASGLVELPHQLLYEATLVRDGDVWEVVGWRRHVPELALPPSAVAND
jgi:hypothetical protein